MYGLLRVATGLLLTALVAVPLAVAGSRAPDATATGGAGSAIRWQAIATSGNVERAADPAVDDWTGVRRGEHLDPMAFLRTGQKGRATLAARASTVVVEPGSRLQLPAGDGASGRLVQTTGTVIYQVPETGRSLEVITPYLTARVDGTVFGVTVDNRFATVSVEEGILEVRSPFTGDSIDVYPGEALRVDSEHANVEMLRRDRPPSKLRDLADTGLRKTAQKRHLKLVADAGH